MAEIPNYILDAFALMAYLKGEPSARRVRDLFSDGENGKCKIHISVINLGEVLYNLERNFGLGRVHETLTIIQSLAVEIVSADDQTVFAAAHVKANYSISYADAFAIVAAQKLGGIVITGDPEFSEVTELINVEWLSQDK